MARPRKPTKLLELSGAIKRNPQRYRDRADEPQGHPEVGDPPADFLRPESSEAKRHLEIWHRFLAEAPPGCITGSDRTRLSLACRLLARIERGEGTSANHAQMERYLAGFGMSGEGRARRGVKQKKQAESEDDGGGWAAYVREEKAARRS